MTKFHLFGLKLPSIFFLLVEIGSFTTSCNVEYSKISDSFKDFHTFPRGGDGKGALLNTFFFVREKLDGKWSLNFYIIFFEVSFFIQLVFYWIRLEVGRGNRYIVLLSAPLLVKLRNFRHNLLKNYAVNEEIKNC